MKKYYERGKIMAKIYIQVGQSIKSSRNEYYKVLGFLGRGANAFAYRCICTSGCNKGIEFVIKIQYNLSNEIRRERFFKEAKFLQESSHPAILTQYDYGTFETRQESFPFIVTNYMPETLEKRMERNDIDFAFKVKYACQLLSAISFLQKKNIIRRDIKPNNIFISNNNAILGDFGLIKELNQDEQRIMDDDINLINETIINNEEGYAAMARYYRTPELVNYANHKDELHIESDVFQLGLVLAKLLRAKIH